MKYLKKKISANRLTSKERVEFEYQRNIRKYNL